MTRALRRRTGRRLTPTLAAFALLAAPLAALVAWQLTRSSPSRAVPRVHAEQLKRTTIYESRDDPGYTSWVGAWTMPDGALMTTFVEAMGSVDRPGYDFSGLKLFVRYMRSADGGLTWRLLRSEPFTAALPHGFAGQATIALDDGTILRRVNGDDLRNDPTIPHTAYLQRLGPGATHWGAPQILMDSARFTYQISRLRQLSDGRLIATGNVWAVSADTPPAERSRVPSTFLLMVSSDDGRTWRSGLTIPEEAGYLPGNEWDTAELPNGDLLAVMRTYDSPTSKREIRRQALLVKDGDGWTLMDVKNAPLPHSGHPELLATREGPILHIATTGVHYTRDGGRSWSPLEFSPRTTYRSPYYPRAVQTDDGLIHVFGHVGADDPFGAADQSITMDTFRLVPERAS